MRSVDLCPDCDQIRFIWDWHQLMLDEVTEVSYTAFECACGILIEECAVLVAADA